MLTIKVEEISAAMYHTIDELKKSSETEVCLGSLNGDVIVSKDTAVSILESLLHTALASYVTGVNDDASKGYLCKLKRFA